MPAHRRPAAPAKIAASPRNAKSAKTASPAKDAASAAPKKSEEPTAAELALLGARDAAPASRPVVQRKLAEVLVRRKERGASEGEWAFDDGRDLVQLHRWGADAHYPHGGFIAFVRKELGIQRTAMYRYLSVAKYATRSQARWGIDKVVAIGALIEKLAESAPMRDKYGLEKKPTTINDLKNVRFQLRDGTTVDFGGRVTEAGIDALLLATTRGSGPRIDAEYVRRNAELRDVIQSHPELKGVVAKYRLRGKRRQLHLRVPASADLRRVLKALLAGLPER